MATSSGILQSYLNSETKTKLRPQERAMALLNYNRSVSGGDFLTPLNYYLDILENTNAVLFAYMNNAQKKSLLYRLQMAELLLLAEQQYEQDNAQYEHVKKYNEYLKKCRELIDKLNREQSEEVSQSPEQGYATDGYPVKYVFIEYARCFAQQILKFIDQNKKPFDEDVKERVDAMSKTVEGFSDRKTKTIKEAMGWFNEKRLYWVWGSSLLLSVLELIPKDFFNTEQATEVIKAPGTYTGALSWGLYYFRFALNLSLLLKHTISGPWMTTEEAKIPWTERFATQWDQRKFDLLNDSLWATCNIICFFVLNAKNGLGPWGDMLTLALLLFDVGTSLWSFAEQQTKHNKEMLEYSNLIANLEDKIKRMKENLDPNDPSILEAKIQLNDLKRAQRQCSKDWDYKKFGLITGVAYAIGLLVAFAILTTPFAPGAGPVIMAVGAVFCFALTVIYNAVKSGTEIYKAIVTVEELKQECKDKINKLKELLLTESDSMQPEELLLLEKQKKFLFLEINKLEAETDYQRQVVIYQTMNFFRSMIIEVITPAIIFASFVFLPMGAGFGALGVGLVLAIASHLLINAVFQPKKDEVVGFDDAKYERYCNKILKSESSRFFDQVKKENIESEDLHIKNLLLE